MLLNVWKNVQGVDSVCGNPNSQGVDPEVKTLEDPDECNGAFIMRVVGDNMKGECRSLLMSMSMRI